MNSNHRNARIKWDVQECERNLPSNLHLNLTPHGGTLWLRGQRDVQLGPYYFDLPAKYPFIAPVFHNCSMIYEWRPNMFLSHAILQFLLLLSPFPPMKVSRSLFAIQDELSKITVAFHPLFQFPPRTRMMGTEDLMEWLNLNELIKCNLRWKLSKMITNIICDYVHSSIIKIVVKKLDGQKEEMVVLPDWTVRDIKNILTKAEYVDPNQIRLIHKGCPLYDDSTLVEQHVQQNNVVHIIIQCRGDIGHWTELPRSEPIMRCEDGLSVNEVKEIIEDVRKRKGREGESNPFRCGETLISGSMCKKLCNRVPLSIESDLQIELSLPELQSIIGFKFLMNVLSRFHPGNVDVVKLRRVRGTKEAIPFHLDFASKTMQIVLNDDYQGRKLSYLTEDGKTWIPERRVGSFTIHDDSIVHGVTEISQGERISLFLLQL
jgi:hypothetical protein